MKTEKQLKSFRIELQKSQEQQERRRIQQETAKVFLGTVIQRGGVVQGYRVTRFDIISIDYSNQW